MDNIIDKIFSRQVGFLADAGPDDDIAISSRIRLARNISVYPFPSAASVQQLHTVCDMAILAVTNAKIFGNDSGYFLKMDEMPDLDKQLLLERRLISRDFVRRNGGNALFVKPDESCAVMINEEDHLRIQALRSGLQLEKCFSDAREMDQKLENQIPFARNDSWGYLTSCPSNVGTGMRASVMLHLPALTLSNKLKSAIQGVSKLGLTARGFLGEGTQNLGNLIQISNQSTLGETEYQIIERLNMVVKSLIEFEKNERQNLFSTKRFFLLDIIGRAYGILLHAYLLNSTETVNNLSLLRLGVDADLFNTVNIHTVNGLFVATGPAHLQKYAKRELSATERDVYRATLVREQLRQLPNENGKMTGAEASESTPPAE